MTIKPLKGWVVCKKKKTKITIIERDLHSKMFARYYANKLNRETWDNRVEFFARKAELRVIEESK